MTAKEKILDIAMLLGTAAAVLTALFAGFARECDELRDSTFRLHILANSDSEEDQKMKYALRDYIITDMGAIFTSCETKAETVALAQRSLPYIEQRANEFLQSRGYALTASCTVGKSDFPTRVYSDFTLPAGTYDSLQVVIGEGGGKNWWCVLYPSVCIRAASAGGSPVPTRAYYESRKTADRSTADSLKAQHGGIEYRFAVYDVFKSILDAFRGL